MDALAGILLHMQPLDPDQLGGPVGQVDFHRSLADDGVSVLADLIALRQILIEVVLALKHAAKIDLRLQAQARPHSLFHAIAVQDRQHAGHGGVHKTDMGVGRGTVFGAGAAEQFGLAGDLGMNLQAHNHFPVTGAAFHEVGHRGNSLHHLGRGGGEAGGLLQGSGHPQHGGLIKRRPQDLQPQGQPLGGQTCRD